jgi:hypothetical protein
MAYDAAHQVTVLRGGDDGNLIADGKTWGWDGSAWSSQDGVDPSARRDHVMAYDSARGVMVLFGGYAISGLNSETWEYGVAP